MSAIRISKSSARSFGKIVRGAAVGLGVLACFLSSSVAQAEGVGASMLTLQYPFFVSLTDAMKDEAQKLDVKLEFAIANQDLNKQIADIEDFITKGVDVIIISPVDSDGVRTAVARAERAGIKVVTVDIPANGVKVASHVGTDNFTGGVKAGDLMAKVLDGKGDVAIIDYPTVQSVVDRVNGFKKSLESHPGLNLVAVQAGVTRPEALSTAQNLLQAHPNLVGIFGFGDDAALAAASAVGSANLTDKVKVIGFDGMEEARAAVAKGSLVGVIAQYPDEMGRVALRTANSLIKGEAVPEQQPIEPGVVTKDGETK